MVLLSFHQLSDVPPISRWLEPSKAKMEGDLGLAVARRVILSQWRHIHQTAASSNKLLVKHCST